MFKPQAHSDMARFPRPGPGLNIRSRRKRYAAFGADRRLSIVRQVVSAFRAVRSIAGDALVDDPRSAEQQVEAQAKLEADADQFRDVIRTLAEIRIGGARG